MKNLKEELNNALIDMINDIIEKFFSTKEKQDHYLLTHIPYLTELYIRQVDKRKIKRIEKLFKILYEEDMNAWHLINLMIEEIFTGVLFCRNTCYERFCSNAFIKFEKVVNKPKVREAIDRFCLKCYSLKPKVKECEE